jgi:molecular chaperone GrpE
VSEDKKDGKSPQPEDSNVVDLSGFDTETSGSDEVESLKKDVEKWRNDYLYLRADFDNYKKAAIKERSDLTRYGTERVLVEVLNLVDTFDQALALEITPDNYTSFREGMQLLRANFEAMFGRMGVQRVESQGQPFDPNMHEAISSEPTDALPPGHISRVFKAPYKLHDRIIRPGQVVVAREIKKDESSG